MMTVAQTIGWPAPNGAKADDNDRIALYVRLSRIFRQHITSGAWERGARLPTIPELCREYQVAAITVRQALGLLSNDGLIISRRGSGTYVTGVPSVDNSEHRTANSSLHAPIPTPKIKILKRARHVALPPELSSDQDDESYAQVMKIHYSKTAPFAVMNVFVASRAYERLPKGREETTRISALFREFSGIPIARDRQLFTISYADRAIAQHLKCSLGSVLIQMRSWWFDDDDKVVFAGSFLYRGDMFVLERGSLHPVHGLLPSAHVSLPKSGTRNGSGRSKGGSKSKTD
jgi:GntR family transcriptional regulator